eukprot:2969203-Rhodomonas_salina.5
MSGTDLCVQYAMSGTALGIRYAMPGIDVGSLQDLGLRGSGLRLGFEISLHSLATMQSGTGIGPRIANVSRSGTDAGHAAIVQRTC